MRNKGKILFLTLYGRVGASSRYRVYQYLPMLSDAGYSVEVLSPKPKKYKGIRGSVAMLLEKAAILKAAAFSDIIFIQKRLFKNRILTLLKLLGKKIIYDIDDAIFLPFKNEWDERERKNTLICYHKTIKVSDVVIAGNNYLKGCAMSAGSKRTEVIPTVVDLSKYNVKSHNKKEGIVLGWIGNAINLYYLRQLSDVFRKLGYEFPDLKIIVVADKDFVVAGVNIENRRWSEETEARDILDMDIGIMPLEENDWSRGKCGLKLLQYMACGIPVVCSSVGANIDIVKDGKDGYLVAEDTEWLQRLRELVLDDAKRAAMGVEARNKVEKYYCTDAVMDSYIKIYDYLLDGHLG